VIDIEIVVVVVIIVILDIIVQLFIMITKITSQSLYKRYLIRISHIKNINI
jgi:hypothetical protein